MTPRMIPNDTQDDPRMTPDDPRWPQMTLEQAQVNPWMTPNDLWDDPIWPLERSQRSLINSWDTRYDLLQHIRRSLKTNQMCSCNKSCVHWQHTVCALATHYMTSSTHHMFSCNTPCALLQHTIATHHIISCDTPYDILQQTCFGSGWRFYKKVSAWVNFLYVSGGCDHFQAMAPGAHGANGASCIFCWAYAFWSRTNQCVNCSFSYHILHRALRVRRS